MADFKCSVIVDTMKKLLTYQYTSTFTYTLNFDSGDAVLTYSNCYIDIDYNEARPDRVYLFFKRVQDPYSKDYIGGIVLGINKSYEFNYVSKTCTFYIGSVKTSIHNARGAGRKPSISIDTVLEYYNQGMSMQWIAEELNCSIGSVSNKIKQAKREGRPVNSAIHRSRS